MWFNDTLIPKMRSIGVGVVQDVRYVTDPLIHKIEQPLTNLYTDARTVAVDLWSVSQVATRLAAYWVGAWLMYSFVAYLLPGEVRSLENTLSRAYKRMRLR